MPVLDPAGLLGPRPTGRLTSRKQGTWSYRMREQEDRGGEGSRDHLRDYVSTQHCQLLMGGECECESDRPEVKGRLSHSSWAAFGQAASPL